MFIYGIKSYFKCLPDQGQSLQNLYVCQLLFQLQHKSNSPTFANMDLGDLTYVSFSTLDDDLALHECRASLQARDQLSQQLLAIQGKLLVAQQAQRSLTEKLRQVGVTRHHLGLSSSNIANHPVVMRLSALTTVHHLMHRYQLVLLRDIMRMKHALGMSVRPQLWESWYHNESQLQGQAPNVHNLFLWSLELQEHEGNSDILPLTRFMPWRPTE